MTCPKCASNLVDGSKQCNVCFATLVASTPSQPPMSGPATSVSPAPTFSSPPPQFGVPQANRNAPPNYAVNAPRPQQRSGINPFGALGLGGGTLTLILVLFRVGSQAFNAAAQYDRHRAQNLNVPAFSINQPAARAGMPSGFPTAPGNGVQPGFAPRPSFGQGSPFAHMDAQNQQMQSRMDESQRRLQETMDANRQQMQSQMAENQRRLQENMAANQQQMHQRMEDMNARARASMPSNFGPGQMHGPGFGGSSGFPGPMGPHSMPGFGGDIR